MKIALVGLSYPFRGGISHYTTVLHKALGQQHQVFLFGLKRQYPSLLFPGKTQLDHSLSPLSTDAYEACIDSINPYSWWKTYKKIAAYSPDFVLFSWWHPFFAPCFGSIAWLLKTRAKISCCFLCHNVFAHEPSILDKLLVRLGLSKGSAFIVHARQQANEIEKLFADVPVLINPHPRYDIFCEKNSFTRTQARQNLNIADKKVILFFGLIRRYKGLQYLLEAMLLLPKETDFHLLLIGEFYDDPHQYQPLLDKLLKRQQLTLINRYIANEEVGLYFKAADVFVAPYLDATQSGVIQIAYSFALPVIATRVGGLPEVIKDQETGLIVDAGEAQGLQQAIHHIFKNERLQMMSKKILQEKDKYSWKQMVLTIEKIPKLLHKKE